MKSGLDIRRTTTMALSFSDLRDVDVLPNCFINSYWEKDEHNEF